MPYSLRNKKHDGVGDSAAPSSAVTEPEDWSSRAANRVLSLVSPASLQGERRQRTAEPLASLALEMRRISGG